MKIVIRNVKTNKVRVEPVEVRYKKDRVQVVRDFAKSLSSDEKIDYLYLDAQGK